MIIGGIYLTKKAKKAYRKHQTEKAAQRLTEAVSVEDPSDELNLIAPPSSPTGSQLSLRSSPDAESPSSVFSVRNVRASRSSSDLRSPSSQYSSYSNSATGVKEFEQFIRRQSNDYLHYTSDQPPSYDTVISRWFSPRDQHADPMISEPLSAMSFGSAIPSWSPKQSIYAQCPTCSAIMQQHQRHELAGHPLAWPHSYHQHHSETNGPAPLQGRSIIPTIPELPDSSVYQRFQVAGPPRPIIEALDTGTYMSEASIKSAKAIAAVELPTEVPEGFSHLSVVDTDEKHIETDRANGISAKEKLPA